MTTTRTLRTPADLADAGLIVPDRLPALQQVAARYAVAVTPASLQLIGPPHSEERLLAAAALLEAAVASA